MIDQGHVIYIVKVNEEKRNHERGMTIFSELLAFLQGLCITKKNNLYYGKLLALLKGFYNEEKITYTTT